MKLVQFKPAKGPALTGQLVAVLPRKKNPLTFRTVKSMLKQDPADRNWNLAPLLTRTTMLPGSHFHERSFLILVSPAAFPKKGLHALKAKETKPRLFWVTKEQVVYEDDTQLKVSL